MTGVRQEQDLYVRLIDSATKTVILIYQYTYPSIQQTMTFFLSNQSFKPIYLSFNQYISIYLSTYNYYLYIHLLLSFCPMYLSNQCIYLSTNLSNYLSIYIYMHIYPSTFLSIYPTHYKSIFSIFSGAF